MTDHDSTAATLQTTDDMSDGMKFPVEPLVILDEPAKAKALTLLASAAADVSPRRQLTTLAELAELLGIDRGQFYDEATAENLRRSRAAGCTCATSQNDCRIHGDEAVHRRA